MTYRERRLARAERLREWAYKRRAKSASAFESARRIADTIPLGQPILVGHHSERHHRRDITRIDNGMRKGIESQEMARDMDSRANGIEYAADRAIYRDDPDAIERLTEKIADLEAKRDSMKTRNAEFRKTHASGWDHHQAIPHQPYELQNLGGNITRERHRLAQLIAAKTSSGAPIALPDAATALERAGLSVTATQTQPSRPGKKPRAVWNVTGNLAYWRPILVDQLGGSWYHGVVSFWDDPADRLEDACLDAEFETHRKENPECDCEDCNEVIGRQALDATP